MNEHKSFKNTLFHLFTLFTLITAGRIFYDYKITVYAHEQFLQKAGLPISKNEVFMEEFYSAVAVDVGTLFALFVVMSLLMMRYNRSNKQLNHSLKERDEELDAKDKFLNSYLYALNSNSILTKTDKEGIITYANKKFLEETGYELNEVIGKSHSIIRHPETPDYVYEEMWETIKQKRVWSSQLKGLSKDGRTFINKVTIIPILNHNNELVEYLSPRVDITELVQKKEELEHLLVTDQLTNLPNRNKLMKDIFYYDTTLQCVNVALINIDRFKEINDFYGYDIADDVLIKVAYRLKELGEKFSFNVYKLPSDEYALFAPMCSDAEDFVKKVKSIVYETTQTSFNVQDQEVVIHISCGIAYNVRPVMVKADMAMQRAKLSKRNVVVYDPSLDVENNISQNIKGISMIKSAIKADKIVPYFQPIYNLTTNKIEKYESLARIEESSSVVPPVMFIQTAIKSKLYPNITKAILIKTFDFFKDKDYEFSINCSIEDISNTTVVEYILEQLKEFKHPEKVVFELLETEEVKDYNIVKEFISKVKVFGCKIAVDDFGSGYSNFLHILELNIDYIKIDSSLVKNILRDENARIITRSIINFAKDLGVKTIAEFVEDEESMELLKEMGADYIQGYYIGKPEKGLHT